MTGTACAVRSVRGGGCVLERRLFEPVNGLEFHNRTFDNAQASVVALSPAPRVIRNTGEIQIQATK